MDHLYKLSTWKHPATGQVRVYISGGRIRRGLGDKVYFVAVKPTPTNPQGIDGRIQSAALREYAGLGAGQTPRDIGLYFIEAALKERGWEKATFASIVETIEGRGPIVEAPPFSAPPPTAAEIAAAADRAELLAAAADVTGCLEDYDTRIKRATARVKADPKFLGALASLKITGTRRKNTKAWLKEIEQADTFSALIGVALTPTDITTVQGRCAVKIGQRIESNGDRAG